MHSDRALGKPSSIVIHKDAEELSCPTVDHKIKKDMEVFLRSTEM